MAYMCAVIIFFLLSISYEHHTALFTGTATMHVFHLFAASLFAIFISTCTMSNFKLIVSKNETNFVKFKNKGEH